MVQLVGRTSPSGESRLVVRGLATCGSVHSCPMCASAIMRRRADELTQALEHHHRRHGALVTLTLRHARGMSLELLHVLLSRSYSELKGGRPGARLRAELGHVGDVRAAEQTHGEAAGWHPHLHALWFLRCAPAQTMARTLAEAWQRSVRLTLGRLRAVAHDMVYTEDTPALRRRVIRTLGTRWTRGDLATLGREAQRQLASLGELSDVLPDVEHGVDVQPLSNESAGTYLAKLGCELSAITKWAHGEHLTSWQIAQRAARGDRKCRVLWHEHAEAMRAKRHLTWSRGCRAAVGLAPERPDADLAADEIATGETETLLGEIQPEQWDGVAHSARQLLIADIAERYAEGELPPIAEARDGPTLGLTERRDVHPVWWERLRAEAEASARGARTMQTGAREQRMRRTATMAEIELEREELRDYLTQDLGLCPF